MIERFLPGQALVRGILAAGTLAIGAGGMGLAIIHPVTPSIEVSDCLGQTPGARAREVSLIHPSLDPAQPDSLVARDPLDIQGPSLAQKTITIYESAFPYGAEIELQIGDSLPTSHSQEKIVDSKFVSFTDC